MPPPAPPLNEALYIQCGILMHILEVVVVVCLGGRHEGQVVATVSHRGVQDDQEVPQPDHGEVRPHDDWSHTDRHQVREEVLQRVGINGHDADRSGPLVMSLVDVFVQQRMVSQPAGV